MAWTRPTLATIDTRIQSDLESRLDDSQTFLRRAITKVLARIYAGAIHLLYGFLEYMQRQLFITTAENEFLDKHGIEFGLPRTAAVKGTGSGTATGTTGTVIPVNTELQSAAGVVYLTDAAATIVAGVATIAITAKVASSDGNESGGVILTFVSPITDINTSFTLDSNGISNGADEELKAAYSSRILTRKRKPPHGGADTDYEMWAKEISGVTRAWTIQAWQGIGTIGLAFVRDDDSGIIFPDLTERTAVYDYIISHTDPGSGEMIGIPVTAIPGFKIIELTAKTINMTIAIYPNTVTVQTNIITQLKNLFYDKGGSGQTIYRSWVQEAISAATAEDRNRVIIPTIDSELTASTSELQVLGVITWQNY